MTKCENPTGCPNPATCKAMGNCLDAPSARRPSELTPRCQSFAAAAGSSDPVLIAVNAARQRVEDLRSACAEIGQYTAACQLDDACDALKKAAGVWNHNISTNNQITGG